jgi:transcriptional regulator with XRE-family HTH domain
MGAGRIPEWTLADRLRKARDDAAMKQTELAEETGIARSSIVNYESGKSAPRRPALAAWAFACGVSFDWLAYGTVTNDPEDGGDQVFSPRACYDNVVGLFSHPAPLPLAQTG